MAEAGAEDDRAELDKQLLEAQEHLDVATGALGERGDDDPAEAVLAAQVAAQEALVASGASTRQDFDHARVSARPSNKRYKKPPTPRARSKPRFPTSTPWRRNCPASKTRPGGSGRRQGPGGPRPCLWRDGIPAMILNGVVSELDNVVNEVLATLSGGTLGVRIETQREKKTGGVADTLEVIVSDGVTDRPYATFSGGSASRSTSRSGWGWPSCCRGARAHPSGPWLSTRAGGAWTPTGSKP